MVRIVLAEIRCQTFLSLANAQGSLLHRSRKNTPLERSTPTRWKVWPAGRSSPFDRGAARIRPMGRVLIRFSTNFSKRCRTLLESFEPNRTCCGRWKRSSSSSRRSGKVCVHGNREYNTGWHTALDLSNLLTVSEAITRAAIERKESRGGHFREDYQDKDKTFGELNIIVRRGPGGEMQVVREKIPPMPAELKQIIRGATTMTSATFSVWRGSAGEGQVLQVHDRNFRRHGRARRYSQDSGRAGERSCCSLEL